MIEIIQATEESVGQIQQISREVWPVAYENIITPQQIEYMLDLMYSETSLRNQFAEGVTFLLALENKHAVGFAAYQEIRPLQYKLHKLYVLSTIQSKGVGKMLLQRVVDEVTCCSAVSIELQVNKKNDARFFYEKMGFAIDREDVFEIGNGFVMDDYIMLRKLV